MKPWIIVAIVAILSMILILLFYQFSLSDTHGYALIVEITEPYPDEYLPISEWDLIGMPTLIFAMNETGVQKNLTQEEWQKIFNFLEASEGIIEFSGDFYQVILLRI